MPPTELERTMSSRRMDLNQIIKARDEREICRHCFMPMIYRRVPKRIEAWAPSSYAWFCISCGCIALDGSIDPNDTCWEDRWKASMKSRMLTVIAPFIRNKIKNKNNHNRLTQSKPELS